MSEKFIALVLCVCCGLFLALVILQAASGCGQIGGSCIQVEDFLR